jgi:hypothetical protein
MKSYTRHATAVLQSLLSRLVDTLVDPCSCLRALETNASKNKLIVAIAVVSTSQSSFISVALCNRWGGMSQRVRVLSLETSAQKMKKMMVVCAQW